MSPVRDSALRIVVLGYVVRGPLGGMVWSNLQYLRGLAALGHDVWFVEDSDDYPSCYDPVRGFTDTDPSYGLAFATTVFARIGLGDRWAYHDAHGRGWLGPGAPHVLEACARADLLLDLCGINPIRPWLAGIPARALVDEDPAFTQVKHLTDPEARRRAAQHTAFFTFGANFGRADCRIPDDGLPWQPTRQPVVLDDVAVASPPARAAFTTVMQWESYPAREYGGRRYGMKSDAFAPYLDLPRASDAAFEIALGGPTAPRALLREHGWRLRDPLAVTRDPWTYERYIAGSRAEFSVAKHGYVTSRSGWFSERTVTYLAHGRPAVVQETGFSEWLPSGLGVLGFDDPDAAREAVADVQARYAAHARAARELVEAHFSAPVVLSSLLESALGGARSLSKA